MYVYVSSSCGHTDCNRDYCGAGTLALIIDPETGVPALVSGSSY